MRASIERFIAQTRQTFLAGGDSPMETILVQRIIATYLDVTIRQSQVMEAVSERARARFQRYLIEAQRRQVESIRALQEFRQRRDEPPPNGF
jgi:hypothetical protein